MYLIIGNEKTCHFLSSELSRLNISTHPMPCVQLIPDIKVINQLKQQINNFEVVIITSPAAIDYTRDVFKYANENIIFIVSGKSSYTKLRQYTKNKIYSPNNDSGAEAIIHQILERMDLRQKNIALIQGGSANNQIWDYLSGKSLDDLCTLVVVYEQKWFDLDTQFLKKLFMSNSLQGIILTSSSHSKYLFSKLDELCCRDILQHTEFITFHAKIKQVLQNFGVVSKILVSDTASNESLIDLMEKLHGRCTKYSEN